MAIMPFRVSEMSHIRVPFPVAPTMHTRTKTTLKIHTTALLLLDR